MPVLVNEVLTHTVPPLADAIELYNPTATDANIGGWFISDDFSNPKKFRVPNGKIVPAGGYLVFNETDFNPPPGTPPSFSFSAKGDEAYIFSGDGTHLTGYLHGYQFGAAESGVPFGRYHTSTGAVHFVAMSSRTLSATNALPKVGPVVISEIMYHPVDLAGAVDNSQDEYVELHNFSNQDVPLFDPLARTNTWRLRGGVEFDFPTNVTLKASNYLVVVSFDVADAGLLAAFRGTYGLGADALIHGPYRGKLDNSHDSVALYRPDQAETGEAPYVLIDRVEYSDSPPWTIAADGFGPALQRLRMTEYGNDLINWTAVAPNPGGPSLAGLAPTIIAQPTDQTVVASQSASFSVSAEGTPPRRYQWLFNGGGLPGATGPNLTLNNVGADQTGGYSVIVFNTDGVAQSKTAMLTVLVPAAIIVQPQSQTVRAGTNVTLSVTATSSTTISYQWRRNGLNLPGANSSTLVLNNVSDANNGDYSVVLTDAVGPLTSAPATLWVVYVPVILQQPQNMTAVVGDNVTFTVQVTGTTPMGFRWRRESSTFVAQGQAALTIPNVQLNNAGKFSVVITNAANLSVTSSNAVLTVLTDTDGDHIPDVWETANGFDPNDSRDGALDSDGDTMTNWQEYVAGTDPHDPESYLKVNRLAVGNSATIEFTAVSNKTYSIEYKDSLGRLSWSKLTDVTVQATNRTAVVTDPNAGSSRYYRLITPLRP